MKNNDPLIFNQDFQTLIAITNNTEKINPIHFDLTYYLNNATCGTMGCAIGHYLGVEGYYKANIEKFNENLMGYSGDNKEWAFLFYIEGTRIGNKYSAPANDPISVANRLRKYIYYKLHKREMLGDFSTKEGREKYNKVRNMEGNHNFVNKAKSHQELVLT